jgi:hypothetical protein
MCQFPFPDAAPAPHPAVFSLKGKKSLDLRRRMHMFRLAQIARACGRVSVGGDPDKRPVNRH